MVSSAPALCFGDSELLVQRWYPEWGLSCVFQSWKKMFLRMNHHLICFLDIKLFVIILLFAAVAIEVSLNKPRNLLKCTSLCHRAQLQWSAASRICESWCRLCRHMQSTSWPSSATFYIIIVKHAKLHTVALCSLNLRTSAYAVLLGLKMKTSAVSSSKLGRSITLSGGTDKWQV